jgi:hypothetical protein
MKTILSRQTLPILLLLVLTACNMPQKDGSAPNITSVSTKAGLTPVEVTQTAQQSSSPASPTLTVKQPTNTLTPTSTQTVRPTNTQAFTLTPTGTKEPTRTPIPDPGTIAGGIYGYPYGSVPSLAIVAFGQEPPYNYSYWITVPGATNFAMSSSYLIPAHYLVVAYDSSGHTGGCTVYVQVISNETVACDITNWGGGYPSKPSDVPSP